MFWSGLGRASRLDVDSEIEDVHAIFLFVVSPTHRQILLREFDITAERKSLWSATWSPTLELAHHDSVRRSQLQPGNGHATLPS